MMWEVFGAQCDRKLMRSKELLASLPTPTEGVNDIKEECSTGTHKQTKRTTTHILSVLYGYTRILHYVRPRQPTRSLFLTSSASHRLPQQPL